MAKMSFLSRMPGVNPSTEGEKLSLSGVAQNRAPATPHQEEPVAVDGFYYKITAAGILQ